MSDTLLSHIALRLVEHPENLATEALAFVLKKSAIASNAFVQYLRALAPDIPDYLTYETQQVGLENSIPDLKCLDSNGKLRVIVENKFWAGLTDNQPVTYIQELRQAGTGLLVFVVPEVRCGLIWDEMLARCKRAEITAAETEQRGTARVAALGQGRYLAVVSWRSLLDALSAAADLGADFLLRNDILQLKGLCNRMDTEAFLPLRSDELTNVELARRIVNYCDLPFDIVREAESRGYCDRKGLKETAQRYGSGAYVRIGDYMPWIGFDASAWSRLGISPIWVSFSPQYGVEIQKKLVRFRTAKPCRCFDMDGRVIVPLSMVSGVEKAALVEGAVQQIGEIVDELGVRFESNEAMEQLTAL